MSRACSSCWPRLARCAEHLLTPSSVRLWRRIAETAVAALPQEGALLDLGCGTGTVLRFIREERFDAHLVGIDIDPPSLATARWDARELDIQFHRASADAVPLPAATFDIIVSSLVFHHLAHDQKRRAFREARRLLKPGGTFLLCDISAPSHRWLVPVLRPLAGAHTAEAARQIDGELLSLAHEAGATVHTPWTMIGALAMHRMSFSSGKQSRGSVVTGARGAGHCR